MKNTKLRKIYICESESRENEIINELKKIINKQNRKGKNIIIKEIDCAIDKYIIQKMLNDFFRECDYEKNKIENSIIFFRQIQELFDAREGNSFLKIDLLKLLKGQEVEFGKSEYEKINLSNIILLATTGPNQIKSDKSIGFNSTVSKSKKVILRIKELENNFEEKIILEEKKEEISKEPIERNLDNKEEIDAKTECMSYCRK